MRKIFLLFALIWVPASSSADEAHATPWQQQELTELFMRSLTKNQCMDKTISTLVSGCSSGKCLTTLAGISGDCVALASGRQDEFCASYAEDYIETWCAKNVIDARKCIVLHSGKSALCERSTVLDK